MTICFKFDKVDQVFDVWSCTEQLTEVRYCPKCGSMLYPNTRFCVSCGAPIYLSETVAVTPRQSMISPNASGQKKRGSKLKWIGIVVGIFVVLTVVGAAFSPSFRLLITKLSSPYSIQVTKVAVDQTSNSSLYYILSIDASYSGSANWHVYPGKFQLVTSSLSVYGTTFTSSESNPLREVILSNGQHNVGQVAFNVPNGQTPSKVEYIDQVSNIKVESNPVPQISSWVSYVYSAEISLQSPKQSFVIASGTIQNLGTRYYYTGDIISVKVSITYIGANPISVTSITDSDKGFTIQNIQPSLPVNVPGNGQQVSLIVNVIAPPSSYSGALHLIITVSS